VNVTFSPEQRAEPPEKVNVLKKQRKEAKLKFLVPKLNVLFFPARF